MQKTYRSIKISVKYINGTVPRNHNYGNQSSESGCVKMSRKADEGCGRTVIVEEKKVAGLRGRSLLVPPCVRSSARSC